MFKRWLRRLQNQISSGNTRRSQRGTRPTSRLRVEHLEDRLAPAVTTFSDGVLTVDLNNASEAATLSNDGASITLSSNNAITGDGSSFATASVTKLVLTDTGNNAGQSIVFGGTTAYSLAGGLDSSGVETNTFNQAVTAAGDASINVTAPQNIVVSKNLTGGTGGTTLLALGTAALDTDGVTVQSGAIVTATGTGNVTVTGTGGSGSGISNFGVHVADATITSGGTGTVTVQGTGGAGTGIANYGVAVRLGGTITSGGGAVQVTGQGGGSGSSHSNYGMSVVSATITSGGSGTVTVHGTGGTGSGGANFGMRIENTGTITSGGSGTVTVHGTGGTGGSDNYGIWILSSGSMITSGGGAVQVTGQGGSGIGLNNYGVLVFTSSKITAGGSGTVTVQGTGGADSGSNNHGVYVLSTGSTITSGGGAVQVTGQGGGGTNAIAVNLISSESITTAANGGSINVSADSIHLLNGAINAGANTVTLAPKTNGTAINLGGGDAAGTLGLTDAELDKVTAGTLQIGDANSGDITVSTSITRPSSTAMVLTSGGDVVISGGQINTGGGTLLLDPGIAPKAVKPTWSGADATASTISFASALNINITGKTVDTQYTQLNVSGTVDLTGVDLLLTGGYVPVNGDVFTIVSATSRTGAFNGLPEGATVTFNSETLTVNYTATTVTLTNVNLAPTDIALSNSSVAENQPAGAVVGALSTTDRNAGDTFTYSLISGIGDTDNASFTIDASGNLLTAASFDFEAKSSYSIRVQSSDDEGLSVEKVFTISVTNVNEAPTKFALSNSSVAENENSGTVVGSFSTVDPDSVNPFTYTFAGGADDASFSIDGSTLKTAASFNFEADNSYTVKIRSADQGGLYTEKDFTIMVTNVNEAPAITSNGGGAAAAVNAAENQTAVTTVTASDPDGEDTRTFSLSGADMALFTISTTGELTFNSAPDYETPAGAGGNNVYNVTVTVADSGGQTDSQDISVTVTDVEEGGDGSGGTLIPDTCEEGATALLIRGTNLDDTIVVAPGGRSGIVEVTINGSSQTFTGVTGRIIVFGHDGNDDIQTAGSITNSAWLYGGDGDDRLKGGNGNDVLLGGNGSDLLGGGSGRDLMIGGDGSDRLVGNADDDIIIAGCTDHDANEAALFAIMAQWTRTDQTSQQRVDSLNGGTNTAGHAAYAGPLFTDLTVHDDGDYDLLTGSAGFDWFLYQQNGDNGAVVDKVTDLNGTEGLWDTDLAFINYCP